MVAKDTVSSAPFQRTVGGDGTDGQYGHDQDEVRQHQLWQGLQHARLAHHEAWGGGTVVTCVTLSMILGLPEITWRFWKYFIHSELWLLENQKFHKVAIFNTQNLRNSGGPPGLIFQDKAFLLVLH